MFLLTRVEDKDSGSAGIVGCTIAGVGGQVVHTATGESGVHQNCHLYSFKSFQFSTLLFNCSTKMDNFLVTIS